jgi:ubiquinone/menaquinone biosynthesis C-methylase UbiE
MPQASTEAVTDRLDHRRIRDFYDQVYYRTHPAGEEVPRHLRRLALRFHPWKDARLLDVACGPGMWLQAAAALGALPAGVDISDVALDLCRKALPQADLYCGPAEKLPFADRQFDFVSCLGALEHFLDPRSALREMVRVAKPQAQILLLVPNADFPPIRLGLYRGTNQSGVLEELRSLAEWQELFESAGLVIMKRWRDLHVLSSRWITLGPWHFWPIRLAQAAMLPLWPLCWQYQVYYQCSLRQAGCGVP